eukprot:CAMPEP_0170549786 /NCGR_PEP_ID=MMETSP0211-20121228/7936_1 /TAXON_ID=311385 /ORGANISM="Pseudokeronopsis sp., Strain OXSARD2" /LENGTH=64 /DNA_ID=CAMNT_0010856017 /DNA_START=196 /DNA_END=390 /DNA_ORIENTATION=-
MINQLRVSVDYFETMLKKMEKQDFRCKIARNSSYFLKIVGAGMIFYPPITLAGLGTLSVGTLAG